MMKMKWLTVFVCMAVLVGVASAQEISSIIDTKFESKDGATQIVVEKAPQNAAALPLKAPTIVAADKGDPANPSVVDICTKEVGSLKPPFAMMKIGEREGKPGVAANARIEWDLRKLHLSTGKYLLSYDIAAGQVDKIGGRVAMMFASDTPNPPPLHINLNPAALSFQKNGEFYVFGKKEKMPYLANEWYHVVMQVDLDRRVWDLELNGKKIFSDVPFPELVKTGAEATHYIGVIRMAVEAGFGDTAGGSFMLNNMKLSKVNVTAAKP